MPYLCKVEKLPGEDGVVVSLSAGGSLLEDVSDGLDPGPGDLGRLAPVGLLLKGQVDRGAPEIEEDEDEEGDVPHRDGHVQEVDEVLPLGHLKEVVRGKEDQLGLSSVVVEELAQLEELEHVLVVEIHVSLCQISNKATVRRVFFPNSVLCLCCWFSG